MLAVLALALPLLVGVRNRRLGLGVRLGVGGQRSVCGRLRLVAAVLAAVELRAARERDRRLHDGLEVAEQLAVVPYRAEEAQPEVDAAVARHARRRVLQPEALRLLDQRLDQLHLVVVVVAWSLERRVRRRCGR